MIRYSVIHDKNPREILLLRGVGCRYRKCAFCDYHTDRSSDTEDNLILNKHIMSKVTGMYKHLEIINSGSFPELGEQTLNEILELCRIKGIKTLHFECHWLYRKEIPEWRYKFTKVGTTLKIKTGVESFDYDFRENVLRKGIKEHDPKLIASEFDECCLLFGLKGQTAESMIYDIETGLNNFERVCVNIFVNNNTKLKADRDVILVFKNYVMPRYINNSRVDILLSNTDFGVGGTE